MDAERLSGRVGERSGTRHDELRTSVVLVVGLVVVHLVMGYFVSSLPDAVFDLVSRLSGQELATLFVHVLPWIPLGIVAFFWARDRSLGAMAASVVAAFALSTYVRDVVVRILIDGGHQSAAVDFVDWSLWVITVLLPVGAALGWGIARRRGTSWWPGLAVAAGVAAFFRWLDIDAFGYDASLRSAYLAFVYHALPAVLAGLACWWLEVRRPSA